MCRDPGGYDQERAACEQALCTASATFSRWATGRIGSGNAAQAYAVIGLDAYWDTRDLGGAGAWADRILDATTGDSPNPLAHCGCGTSGA